MSETTYDLRDRLAVELEIKNRALRELRLEDLFFIPISYSKVCRSSLGEILEEYVDKFLENLEKESMVVKIYKSPDKSREIVKMFKAHEFDVDEERTNALARLFYQAHQNYVNPKTGEIDWTKLIQSNSGNYNTDSHLHL